MSWPSRCHSWQRFLLLVVCSSWALSPPLSAGQRAFVTDFLNARVQVVDVHFGTVVETLAVGSGPQGAALIPQADLLYVVSQHDDSVLAVDTNLGTPVGSPIAVGDQPFGIVSSPSGDFLYVTNHNGTGTTSQLDTISVIDTALGVELTQIVVGDFPIGIDILPDGSKLFVANAGSVGPPSVSVVDTELMVEETAIILENPPFWLAVDPAGDQVFVTNLVSDEITVLDVSELTTTAVDIGMASQGVAVISSPPRAFVTNQNDDRLTVIDTMTLTEIAPKIVLPVGSRPIGIEPSPEEDLLFVANGSAGTVSIVNTATLTVADPIEIFGQPGAFGRFVESAMIFADGFESGDTTAW